MDDAGTAAMIVTLGLDPTDRHPFDVLRERHFPVARNFLVAHITLFHKLPGKHRVAILSALKAASAIQERFTIDIVGLRFLGAGVAYDVKSAALSHLRQSLRNHFEPWLSRQDAQPWRPHVTVQNKVDPDTAKRLFAELSGHFQPSGITATGLECHFYRGGPWELCHVSNFAS